MIWIDFSIIHNTWNIIHLCICNMWCILHGFAWLCVFRSATLEWDSMTVPAKLLQSASGSCCCCVNLPKIHIWPYCFLICSCWLPSAFWSTHFALLSLIRRIWHVISSVVSLPAALPGTSFFRKFPKCAVQFVSGPSTGYPHDLMPCPPSPANKPDYQVSALLSTALCAAAHAPCRVRASFWLRLPLFSLKSVPGGRQSQPSAQSCRYLSSSDSKLVAFIVKTSLLPASSSAAPHLPHDPSHTCLLTTPVSYRVRKTTAPGLAIHQKESKDLAHSCIHSCSVIDWRSTYTRMHTYTQHS